MGTAEVELPTIPYARDDALIEQTRGDGQPRVSVYRFDHTAVVIGRGGHQDLELHIQNIADDEVPLYKRPGGGCSVVLDPGNVIVSLVLPLPGIGHIKSAFGAISAWLIAALAACGVEDVVQRGVSDLAIADRKIGGSCVYRTRGLLYYSTTLLVEQNVPLVGRYLQHPPREPAYRKGRPHGQFMGSLVDLCGIHLNDQFLERLNYNLNNRLHLLTGIADK